MLNDTKFEVDYGVIGYESDNNHYADNFKTFAKENTWRLFEEVENDYDCAAVCYVPLFYMTRPISDGRPTRDCLKPLLEDVLGQTKNICRGFAYYLIAVCVLQLFMCGGVPRSPDEEQADFDTLNQMTTGHNSVPAKTRFGQSPSKRVNTEHTQGS